MDLEEYTAYEAFADYANNEIAFRCRREGRNDDRAEIRFSMSRVHEKIGNYRLCIKRPDKALKELLGRRTRYTMKMLGEQTGIRYGAGDNLDTSALDRGLEAWYSEDTNTLVVQTINKELETMNEDNELLNLMQEMRGITTVKVAYSKNHSSVDEFKGQTLYTFKTDLILDVGDMVLVRDRNGFATAVVIKTDVNLDMSGHTKYNKLEWVVQKVDTAKVENLDTVEKETLEKLRAQRAKRRLKEIAGDLGIDEIIGTMRIGRDTIEAAGADAASGPLDGRNGPLAG